MVNNLATNVTPIKETAVPPIGSDEVNYLDRGRRVEEIAGANLRGNVKGIDDFTRGVGTSIKSYRTEETGKLLQQIEDDLLDMKERTSKLITGRAHDGRSVRITPSEIRARNFVAALNQANPAAKDPEFLRGLQRLSNAYQTTIRPVLVRAWTVRR